MHKGLGLFLLGNFKEPLAREITFLLVYLFIDLLPYKVKGGKQTEEREMKKQEGVGGRGDELQLDPAAMLRSKVSTKGNQIVLNVSLALSLGALPLFARGRLSHSVCPRGPGTLLPTEGKKLCSYKPCDRGARFLGVEVEVSSLEEPGLTAPWFARPGQGGRKCIRAAFANCKWILICPLQRI